MVPEQYGFRKNNSTELAIFKLTNQILIHINDKSVTGGIFCDLKKAFHMVNHNILISKLKFYGVKGKANGLVRSYLSDRFQRVIIKNSNVPHCSSTWKLVNHGVPQGSILGPLLFLFYINDLPVVMKENALPILFADDTSLVISNTDTMNMYHELETTLNKAQNWFKSNIMLLNYDKTSFIQFSLNSGGRSSPTAITNSCSINVTSSTKFLGIILESTLNWKQHIDLINSKLQSLGYIICSLRLVLSLKVIKQIYNSYVHSLINYGIIFGGSSSYCKTLFITQKRIIRIIMNAKVRESCRDMFRELGILTLYSQYIYSILMFVVSHREIFTFNNEVHGLNTRQKLDLHIILSEPDKG
jgi:hypothetical protein